MKWKELPTDYIHTKAFAKAKKIASELLAGVHLHYMIDDIQDRSEEILIDRRVMCQFVSRIVRNMPKVCENNDLNAFFCGHVISQLCAAIANENSIKEFESCAARGFCNNAARYLEFVISRYLYKHSPKGCFINSVVK